MNPASTVSMQTFSRSRQRLSHRRVIEFAAIGKAARPGENRGDGVGRGLLALLMQAVMARHRAMRRFGFDDFAIGRQQHRGHQAERAEALRHRVGLHVAIVILAGPEKSARPFERASPPCRRSGDVHRSAWLCRICGLNSLVEYLLENILEAPVIGFEDGVLGREIDRIFALQPVIETGVGEAA